MKLSHEQKVKSLQRLSWLVHCILIKPLAFLNKNPIMLKTGSFHLVYFGLLASLGFMASLSIAFFYLDARGCFSDLPVFLVTLFYVLSCMIGVKALYFFSLGKKFFQKPLDYLNETTMYNQGGVFGIFVVGIVIVFVYDINLMVMMDAMALSGSLGLFFGRLGCFNYGCCFGKPTNGPAHVAYHRSRSKVIRTNPELRGVPLVPTQLYTAYIDLLMFIIFVVAVNIYPADGLISLIFIFIFNGFRMFIQPYRFTEQSDLMNFKKMAIIYLTGYVLIWFVAFLVSGATLVQRASEVSFNPVAWAVFVMTTPDVFLSIVIAGIITFLFFGLHGRQLGTHINLAKGEYAD
ncbi:MAG: prolipoprotein diacylglyceryl transferase family protein [Smithella sp.]